MLNFTRRLGPHGRRRPSERTSSIHHDQNVARSRRFDRGARPRRLYALGRNPQSWGEGADAFDPQRWIDDPAGGGAPSSFCWLPFGAGPRGCLSTRLGLTEVVIGVALLVQRFDVAFDKSELEYKYDLTLNLERTTECDARVRNANIN